MRELCKRCVWTYGSGRCEKCIHWFEDRFEINPLYTLHSSEQTEIKGGEE